MKTKTLLALATGIIGFAATAKASVVFQNINQTLTDGQSFQIGFDGTSITLGSGFLTATYSAPQSYSDYVPLEYREYYPPGSIDADGYNSGTNPAMLLFSTTGSPDPNIYGGSSAVTSGITGSDSNSYNSGWGSGSGYYTTANSGSDTPNYVYLLPNPNKSGWVEFSLNDSSAFIGAAAFITTSGYATVGDTGNGLYVPTVPSAVPEASTSLCLLALGAVGLVARRRRVA